MSYKIGILEREFFSESIISELMSIGSVDFYNEKTSLLEFVSDKHILFIRLKYKITKEILNTAVDLRYIISPTTGKNHIDTQKGIDVISMKNDTHLLKNVRSTAEHIFGLTIALKRKYKSAFGKLGIASDRYISIGSEIFGSKVGIIGYGRLGSILASYFDFFGAKVIVYDIDNSKTIGSNYECTSNIIDLVNDSNIIILAASSDSSNDQFFDRKYFQLMDNKYFINAARGELVNQKDFKDFLNSDKYNGVAIDVYENETILDMSLADFNSKENILFTPHIGGHTTDALIFVETVVIIKFFKLIDYIPSTLFKNEAHQILSKRGINYDEIF